MCAFACVQVSASLALLAGDTSAPHSASLGAVIDGADNVSKPWVHGDGGSSPPQHTFSIHAHACSDPSLAYPDHPFSAAAAQLGPASLQASASQPTFSSITASLDEVVLSYASRHCCAAAMHCVLWYAEVLRRRSTLGRLSAFTKARLASLQVWWSPRMLTACHPFTENTGNPHCVRPRVCMAHMRDTGSRTIISPLS